MQGIISAVRRNSLAENAGIKAGEKLCAVNGVSVHDIIELSYLVADEQIVLTIEDSECRQRQIVIEKYTDEELGLEFEAAVFDGVTTCYNNCVFCFVDQMIPGMRESLYVRDDDYRLSFLYGNFITLTNMKEEDFEQVYYIDGQLPFDFISIDGVEELDIMHPFGTSNTKPIFGTKNLSCRNIRFLGENKTIVAMELVDKSGNSNRAIMFNGGDRIE